MVFGLRETGLQIASEGLMSAELAFGYASKIVMLLANVSQLYTNRLRASSRSRAHVLGFSRSKIDGGRVAEGLASRAYWASTSSLDMLGPDASTRRASS